MIGNFNMEAQNILLNAKKEMNELGHPYIGTEHLLLSILNEGEGTAIRILLSLGVDINKLYLDISDKKNIKRKKELEQNIPGH